MDIAIADAWWQFYRWDVFDPTTWPWTRLAELAAVLLGAALVILFFRIRSVWLKRNEPGAASQRGAVMVAAYDCVWLGLLTLAAIDYLRIEKVAATAGAKATTIHGVPFPIASTLGMMPTPVVWFGLLGGVMISLSGVASRSADGSWGESWALWHLLHPLVGAACGVLAVLIFQAGILSIGSDATPVGNDKSNAAYYVIAFIVGYREKTFRDLIKRLADSIFTTGTEAPSISGITPSQGPSGSTTQVAITGGGLSAVNEVRFGSLLLAPVTKTDSYILVNVPSAAAGGVAVVVTSPHGSAASTFTYT